MKLETVIEMPDFQRRAKAVMSEAERTELVNYLAANPLAGVLLGGGLHKVRFARAGGGKSGGFRTIHYYKPAVGPVFLLTMFAKNEKSNLTARETEYLIQLGESLAAEYGKRQ
ncbi:MAG: type II toxin-antitoxin system RelE/ParE family toxin [Pseudomonadota bacterium]